MYSMICTRPDVSYSLSVTIIYQSDPSEGHWVAVKNILKYLRRTKDVFFIHGDGDSGLQVRYMMPPSNMIKITPNINQVMYPR